MDAAILFFLSSGLFLGWSLGANDAANVFGTAVGTRMIRFATAAAICSIFLILGAVVSGAGAAHTLGKLGSINALAGSFMAAFAAGLSVYLMTKAGLPVSTTQAIVGAIIGWNLFSGTATDGGTLATILSTWVICPLLAAAFAILLYKLVTWLLKAVKPHLLRVDAYTRLGLLLAGAFGAYSLGANNIANVMGVFVPDSPFTDFNLLGRRQFQLDPAAVPARRPGDRGRRHDLFQARHDDGRRPAAAALAGRRLGRRGGPFAGAVPVRLRGTRGDPGRRRPADHPLGAGLELPGGGRRRARHRLAQGRPQPALAGARRHRPWAGWSRR